MPEDNRRYISRVGQTEGPFTVDEIYDMILDREMDHTALFWSERKRAWKPIAGILLDVDPDKIDEFLQAGVKEVTILGSGKDDCTACLRLVDRIFPISKQPVLPPTACRCIPWCRLVIAPVTKGQSDE